MMGTGTTRLALLASAVLFVGVLAAGLFAGGGLELTVTPVAGGHPLLAAPLRPEERFTLRYVHSVDRSPIWEVHSVDGTGRIYVEEERFVMVGAGMGDLPGRGRWTGSDGLQSIQDMHYPIGDFVLRVGSLGVDHTVLWRNTETNLSARAAGKAVRVSARPVSLLYRVWRQVFPHPSMPQEEGKTVD